MKPISLNTSQKMKSTAAGVIPVDWECVKVGDVYESQLGKMLNQKAKDLTPHSTYLTNINVQWGSIQFTSLNKMYFSEKEKEKFALKRGDLLMCEGGEIGRCAIWNQDNHTCYYQKALHRIRPMPERTIPDLLFYYMSLFSKDKLLALYGSRNSIAHFTKEQLLNFPIPLPPLLEQRKIAEILSTWDKALEKLDTLIHAKQQRKKALMQQLLTGKKRLPGFKKKWERLSLSKLGEITKGKGVRKNDLTESGHPAIRYADIYTKYDEVTHSYSSYVTEDYAMNHIVINTGDLVFAMDGETPEDIGKSIAYMGQAPCCVGDHTMIINPESKHSSTFLGYRLNADDVRRHLARHAQGSSIFGLRRDDFTNTPITLPAPAEQTAIANILTACDDELTLLHKHRKTINTQKRGLMQQLLTGKTRVTL